MAVLLAAAVPWLADGIARGVRQDGDSAGRGLLWPGTRWDFGSRFAAGR